MPWIAPVAGAVVGAIASNRQAHAANKPRTAETNQTTTQDPYRPDLYAPDIETVLNYQRGLVQRGAPRVGADGNVYYDPLPGIPGSDTSAPPQPTNTTTTTTTPTGGRRPGRGARGHGSNNGGLGVTSAPNLSTPQGIFGEVARRGLETGNTPTVSQARNVMSNIWGSAAGNGSDAEGEYSGFEGYNPILNRLTGTLENDVDQRVGRDLLLGFLDETGRGGGSSAGSGSDTSVSGASPGSVPTWFANQQNWFGPKNTATSPGANGSGVPDTMVPESFFGTETRKVFDEGANDAELQSLIDTMNKDVERGQFREQAALDAAAAGSGRYGSGLWAGQQSDARRDALDSMLANSAKVRVGDRESRRQARLAALQGVNTRDLGLLNANVQREGIAASERASSAASAAGAASRADELALAKRGQNLQAIGELMNNERYSLGQLGDIGSQLSGDRLSSLGMVPGLEGIGLEGLRTTLGAGEGLTTLRGQNIQRGIANQSADLQRQGMAQQLGMFNAGQQQAAVNDYLRTILGIGGMGGTTHTEGTNVQPGLGLSPTGSALAGAAGGAATGLGIYNTWMGGR